MDYYNIEYTTNVVASCLVLHNVCEMNGDGCNPEWIHHDESGPEENTPPAADVTRRANTSANNIRNVLKEYVNQ